MFKWQIKDFAEYNKLIDATLNGEYNDHIATVSKSGDVNLFDIKMECTNCEGTFDKTAFEQHICHYDDDKQFIFTDYWESRLLNKNRAIKITRENQKELKWMMQQCKENAKNSMHTCLVCQRVYVHASGLSRHMQIHHSDDQKCSIDHIAMAAKMEAKVEAEIDVYKCLICGQVFGSASTCSKHLRGFHPEFGLKEPDSDSNVDDTETSFFEKISTDQAVKCEFCDGMFLEVSALNQHELDHDVNVGYKCSNCEVASRNLKFILNHRKNDCPFEKSENVDKINAKIHFVCNLCDLTFTSLPQLYEHRYMAKHFQTLYNHQTKRHELFCEKCCQIFPVLSDLLEHADSAHTSKGKLHNLISDAVTRPYLCEVCGKGYTQSSHLYQHLRFHKGIKPFKCTFEACTRRFTIRPDLNDHIRKCHTGERPYKCSDCTKTFLTGSVYYQHRLIHRNERRYGCHTCGKRFHRSDALKNHERIHTGEKPYTCGVCSKKFRQKGDRDKHFRSRHQNRGLNAVIEELDTSPPLLPSMI